MPDCSSCTLKIILTMQKCLYVLIHECKIKTIPCTYLLNIPPKPSTNGSVTWSTEYHRLGGKSILPGNYIMVIDIYVLRTKDMMHFKIKETKVSSIISRELFILVNETFLLHVSHYEHVETFFWFSELLFIPTWTFLFIQTPMLMKHDVYHVLNIKEWKHGKFTLALVPDILQNNLMPIMKKTLFFSFIYNLPKTDISFQLHIY